jgi:hypothetical protein
MGSVIKKRRKRMAKKKHRKLLRKTRHQRRNKKGGLTRGRNRLTTIPAPRSLAPRMRPCPRRQPRLPVSSSSPNPNATCARTRVTWWQA